MNGWVELKAVYRRIAKCDPVFEVRHDDIVLVGYRDRKSRSVLNVFTAGASLHQQLPVTGAGRDVRIELMMTVEEKDAPACAKLLCDVVKYGREVAGISYYHSIQLCGGVPGTQIQGILTTWPALAEEFMPLEVEGRRVDLLWVLPLMRGEFEFIRQNGAEAFEERLAVAGVEITNLSRAPVV